MLNQLFKKSEFGFAIFWIVAYIVCSSFADLFSEKIGVAKSLTFALHVVLSIVILVWICQNCLQKEYGLCRPVGYARQYLYYIPIIMLVSCNVWFGVRLNMPVADTVCYVGSMLCVGFLEEMIFRGFLFKAMSRDNVTSAIIVSSLTFGVGHIVNMFNGSGVELVANLCQVCYATAFGFLCVTMFHRGKSLVPCIAAHSTMNMLSAFANETGRTEKTEILTAVYLTAVAVAYTMVLMKTLPQTSSDKEKRCGIES